MMTYFIEFGYLVISIWAWVILAQNDPDENC